MKILMVDDEPSMLEMAKVFLERGKNLEVEICGSAEEALDLLNDGEFDAVVSDYQMKGMSGLELLKEIREQRGMDIPFIILTGKGREEVAIDALNMGANRYIQKKGPSETLYTVLAQAIDQEIAHHRNERTLKESEEEKRRILDSAAEHIIYHGKEHEVLYANKAAADSVGKHPKDLVGKKCYKIWGDEDGPCPDCPVTLAYVKGETVRAEVRSPDGQFWLITGSPVKDYEGDIKQVVEISMNITKRKDAEKRAQEMASLRNAVSDVNQLIVQEDDMDLILQRSCDLLMKYRDYIDVYMAIRLDDDTISLFTHSGEHKIEGWSFTSGGNEEEPPCIKEVCLNGDVKVIENEELECKNCDHCRHQEEHRSILIPMMKNDEVDGILFAALPKDKEIVEEEIELLEEVCADLAFARDKISVDKALRESEKRYKNLFYETPLGVFEYNKTGVITDCNDKFAEMMRYSKDDLIGLDMINVLKDGGMAQVVQTSLKDGIGYYEGEYTTKTGGSTRFGRALFKGMADETGDFYSGMGVVEDITERKEAERALERTNRTLSTLIKNIPGITYRCLADDNWTMLFLSQYLKEFTGYEPEDMLDNRKISYREIIHPDDRDLVRKEIVSAAEKKVPFMVEYRIVTSEGEEKWVWEKGRVVEYRDEGPDILEGILVDITEKKEYEEELKRYHDDLEDLVERKSAELNESEEYKQSIIELMPDIMIKTNREGEYLDIISSSDDKLIQPREKVLGKKIIDLFPEGEGDRVMEHLRKSIDDDVLQIVEYEIPIKDKDLWFEARIVPSGDGEAFALIRDITERKDAERTLYEKNKELESFAYSVSHDLRAPLRAIQGFGTILLDEKAEGLDQDSVELIERMTGAAERMDILMQDLLHYSRLSTIEVDLKSCDVEKILEHVLELLDAEIANREVEIKIERPLGKVMATKTLLEQILCNLISNAIKFVPEGRTPKVTVWSEEVGTDVRLLVKDNGIGIDDEDSERIFKMFSRLHGVERYPGTGVGLAIVKKAVDKLGGRYGVDSEIGSGSIFWVQLKKSVG